MAKNNTVYLLLGIDEVNSESRPLLSSFNSNKLKFLEDLCTHFVKYMPHPRDYDFVEDSELDRYEKDLESYKKKTPVPVEGCEGWAQFSVIEVPLVE